MKKKIAFVTASLVVALSATPLYELCLFCGAAPLDPPPVAKEIFLGDQRLKAHTVALNHPLIQAFSGETGEAFIVKHVRRDSFRQKWESLFALAHEYYILRTVQDIPQVSHLVGKMGNDAFCIRYIPRMEETPLSTRETLHIKGELTHILDALHARGVYHLDMRCRDHIVISPSLIPHLIDFGKAVKLPLFLNGSIGKFFAYEDRLLMLTAVFLMNPDALSSQEVVDLITFYKRKTYLSKRHVSLLNRIEEYLFRTER